MCFPQPQKRGTPIKSKFNSREIHILNTAAIKFQTEVYVNTIKKRLLFFN